MDCTTLFNSIFEQATGTELVKFWSPAIAKQEFHQVSWLKKANNLAKVLTGFPKEDVYMSFNTFKNKVNLTGTRNDIFNCYAFCIDVDYKLGRDKSASVEEAICAIRELYHDNSIIPVPYYIEYGNQFRLIYLLDGHVSGKKQMQALDLVQKRLVAKINQYPVFDFCAETQGLQSFIRLPGSYNTKNAKANKITYKWNNQLQAYCIDWTAAYKEIKIIEEDELDHDGWALDTPKRKTLMDYMDIVLGEWEKPAWYSAWKKQSKKKKHHHSCKELNISRIRDIQTIQEYYKQNHAEIGHRNQLCFAFYIHAKLLYCNMDKVWVALWQFNDNFNSPLSEKKLQNCICTAIHKNYYMKTSTLMEKLGVTKELGEDLNLQCLQPKIKNNAAYCKKYYAKKKLNAKQKQLEKEKKTIIALKKKYKTNKTIAHILHISEKKVERLVSGLIKERKLWSAKILKQFQIIRDFQTWTYLFDKDESMFRQQEEEGFDELYPIIRKERSD